MSAGDVLTRNIYLGNSYRGRRSDCDSDAIVRGFHPAFPFRPNLEKSAPQSYKLLKNKLRIIDFIHYKVNRPTSYGGSFCGR